MSFKQDVPTGQESTPCNTVAPPSYASVIAKGPKTQTVVHQPSSKPGRSKAQSVSKTTTGIHQREFRKLVDMQQELLKLSNRFVKGIVKRVDNKDVGVTFHVFVEGEDRPMFLPKKFFIVTPDDLKNIIGHTLIWSPQSENLLDKSQLWFPTDKQMEFYRTNHANSNGYFDIDSLFPSTGIAIIIQLSGRKRRLNLEVFVSHTLTMLRAINSKGFNYKRFYVELKDNEIDGIFIPIDVFPNRRKMKPGFLNEDNLCYQMFGENNIREIPETIYSAIQSALNGCSHPDYKQIKIEEEDGVLYVELISIIKHLCDMPFCEVPSEKAFYRANDEIDRERLEQREKQKKKYADKSATGPTKELNPVQQNVPGKPTTVKSATGPTKELNPVQQNVPGKPTTSAPKELVAISKSEMKDSWSDSSDDEEEQEETVDSLKEELARLRKLLGKTSDIPCRATVE
jgi:hypothetical protein